MNRLFFLDTSYIIAILVANDQYHDMALAITAQLNTTDRFCYTDAIVFESLNALSKTPFRQAGLRFFEQLNANPHAELLHTTPERFQSALRSFERSADKEWGLVDCLSFLTIQERRIDYALSADKHFEQAGYTALLRTPDILG